MNLNHEKKYGIFVLLNEKCNLGVECQRGKSASTIKVYACNELDKVLQEVKVKKQQCFGKTAKQLYFLVKTDGEIIFSKAAGTREHHLMVDIDQRHAKCKTAGIAFFDQENKLYAIDHDSPDFKPSFDSLQFAIDALVANDVLLAKDFRVKKVQRNGIHIPLSAEAEMPQFNKSGLKPSTKIEPTVKAEPISGSEFTVKPNQFFMPTQSETGIRKEGDNELHSKNNPWK